MYIDFTFYLVFLSSVISPSLCDDEIYLEELVLSPLKHHFLASQFNFITRIPLKDSSMPLVIKFKFVQHYCLQLLGTPFQT